MALVSETCKVEDFQEMLMMPSLKVSQKNKMANAIFEKHLSKLSLSLVNLVIENKREAHLAGIARNFSTLYRKNQGIRTASLVTATPIADSSLKEIKALIKKAYDSEVELSSAVDQDVIGGFILTVEDQQYDASVANSLQKIRKQLLQTSIVK